MADPVKGRTDAGRRREQRALATRARIADAALRLFLDQGYIATSVESIAAVAGVAPATVYQAFGTKQALLARALDATIAGDVTPVPVLERDWVQRVRRLRSPKRRLAAIVAGAADVAARTAPLKDVIRDAAATDAAVHSLIVEDHRRRRQTHRALVELAVRPNDLRPGMTVDRAADTLFLLVSSDNYRIACDVLGWTREEWRDWLVAALTNECFGDVAPA